MRVTREAREKTRQTIVAAARKRFREVGFAATTTREIAAAAGIATGTLFNYFPNKEALGMAILATAGAAAETEFDETRRMDEPLEESIFALIAIQLRHFAPFRPWIGEVLDAGWNPSVAAASESDAAEFRRRHLERVDALLKTSKVATHDRLVDQHFYWTLYLGTLSFWSRDETEHQQATLALLDRSMELFCRSLRERAPTDMQAEL